MEKPIYNHVTGLLDPPENIRSPQVPALCILEALELHFPACLVIRMYSHLKSTQNFLENL